MRSSLPFFLAASLFLGACATAVRTEGTIVVTGTVNKVAGGDDCWAIEVGKTVAEKKFYQLNGEERLVAKLHIQDARATVRILLDSTATPRCRIGTPATVVDIISVDKP